MIFPAYPNGIARERCHHATGLASAVLPNECPRERTLSKTFWPGSNDVPGASPSD